jgi:putative PIG3 family NAD(P)H quinone oxidoreductase
MNVADLPQTMTVIEIRTPGGPDVLTPVSRPMLAPGPADVLIKVAAAGVNRPDLMQRQGKYPPPPGVTDIPGLEVAGQISALGADDATGPPRSAAGRVWNVGDDVCALVAGGGYAETVAAPGVQCLPAPAGVSLIDAAAIPETYFTVWTNVFERGRLAPDEWLLVHGGTSGIGSTAIQLARARGAHVIATAGSEVKCRACELLGAVRAINYRTEDFVAAVQETTQGRGVDVVLDMVGGEYTPKNLECLAREGRLVQIATMGARTATISLRAIMMKRLTITGSMLRARTPPEKGAIAAAVEREIWPLLAAGRIRPIVERVLPFEAAADAHRALEDGEIIGKIVLTAAPTPPRSRTSNTAPPPTI